MLRFTFIPGWGGGGGITYFSDQFLFMTTYLKIDKLVTTNSESWSDIDTFVSVCSYITIKEQKRHF